MTPIAYGMPDTTMFEAADRGEVRLGGCTITFDDPDLECRGPEPHSWRRADDGALVPVVG